MSTDVNSHQDATLARLSAKYWNNNQNSLSGIITGTQNLDKTSLFLYGTLGALSLAGKVCDSIITKSDGGVGLFSLGEDARPIAEIEADINEILTQLNCSTIQEVEALLETKKSEKHSADAQIAELEGKNAELEQNIPASEQRIEGLKNANTALLQTNNNLTAQYENLGVQIEALKNTNSQNPSVQYETNIAYLESQREQINKQIAENNKKYEENQNAIKNEETLLGTYKETKVIYDKKLVELKETVLPRLVTDIESLEGHTKTLRGLARELKKAEKEEEKDSLVNNMNDETKEILDIIKKLNNAKSKDRDKRAGKLDNELAEAIENYYNKHRIGDNKTIDGLARSVGFDV